MLVENQCIESQFNELRKSVDTSIQLGEHFTVSTDLLTMKGMLYLIDEVARKHKKDVVLFENDMELNSFKEKISTDTLILVDSNAIGTAFALEQDGYTLGFLSDISNHYINNELVSV